MCFFDNFHDEKIKQTNEYIEDTLDDKIINKTDYYNCLIQIFFSISSMNINEERRIFDQMVDICLNKLTIVVVVVVIILIICSTTSSI